MIVSSFSIKKIILYGSRARGDYKENSDYDLYIPDTNFKGLIQLLQFEEELEKELKQKIDISTINENEIDEYLKREIQKDDIIIYEQKNN